MQPKRLALALLISAAVLIGWNFLFPIKNQQNTNINPQNSSSSSPSPVASQTPTKAAATPVASATPAQSVRQRTVVIKTPLYDAKFDTQGAVATSWILNVNKDNGRKLHSAGGNKNNIIPLELISQEGLKHVPREAPFDMVTGDVSFDGLLAGKNYEVEGYPDSGGDLEIKLAPNEEKRLNFVIRDSGNNFEVSKAITFKAESYATDLELRVRRGDQWLPQVQIKAGPSTGDQGLKSYSFYSVAPEAVARVAANVERHVPQEINEKKGDHLVLPGDVDWAGVGDTYFAMVVVPARRVQGLEYFSAAYEVKHDSKSEKHFLIRAHVPVPADGSKSAVYIGPKDHYVLQKATTEIAAEIGAGPERKLDLDGLINYGFGGSISRPIAEKLLWCIKKLYELTGSYGPGYHYLHHNHLLRVLSAQVALFKSDEESAEACAKDEGDPGEDQINEAD